MITQAVRNHIQMDRAGSAAICAEIADHLRIKLAAESGQLPRHMMMLVDQMAADQRCARPTIEVANEYVQ